jgi:recombination protein RecR
MTTERLIEIFKRFPGIGPRQAKRFVYFLMSKDQSFNKELASLINNLNQEVSVCNFCFRFFPTNNFNKETCNICLQKRDSQILMIVCRDVDFENIEKTKIFNGYYFILGDSIKILEKEPEKKIRQKELLEILVKREKEGLKEIILALDYNPEGENTERYIYNKIKDFCSEKNIKISTFGKGLSTGTELEYSDEETIKNAIKNRR